MTFSSDIFKEDGPIARHLEGYESRPQQVEMAEAVEEAIAAPCNMIVEAGTGSGKSLAYLVPFIRWAVKEGKRVAVSTFTKALQNQLFVKDLPFLEKAMGLDFRYALSMGSDNYVCLRKANNSTSDLFDTKSQIKGMKEVKAWLKTTATGMVTDMDFKPESHVWERFSRDSQLCSWHKCAYYEKCFYRKAKLQQQEAHVLVTNHSLLFTSLVSETGVLPEFHGLVLDEAHTLEDVATGHFGTEASLPGLERILDGMRKFFSEKHSGDLTGGICKEGKKAVGNTEKYIEKFIAEAQSVFGQESGTIMFEDDQAPAYSSLLGALSELSEIARDLADAARGTEVEDAARISAAKLDHFCASLDVVLGERSSRYVYWVSIYGRKNGPGYSFKAAPIDISREMRKYIFDSICPVVLTSATLSSSVNKADFGYLKERLGLEDPIELALESPFDHENNVLMYMPRRKTDPNRDPSGFRKDIGGDIISMYDILGGRIFALFTSYALLNAVASDIQGIRPDINMLKQGDLPRYVLLDVFKKSRESVLMGTTTFWQGVDVPGTSLECVIITKLPFAVPNDPVNSARIKSMEERGMNSFYGYQLPQAVIMFRQGFGRLIRSRSDRGVVAVLDPRIHTRGYGKEFIKSLPKCRITDSIDDVRSFFE